MNRQLCKLTALTVQRLSRPGRYSDGGGLYLQVAKNGSRSWLFRYNFAKTSHHMGLGSLSTITLSEAREKALECRRILTQGKDPLAVREEQRAALAQAQAKEVTFDQAAVIYINVMEDQWENKKHRVQWRNTLNLYASPIIGSLNVSAITETQQILEVLNPIWKTKNETASRVRGRIEAILDYATALKWRAGDNPARWRGNLDRLLPKPSKVKKKRNFEALPLADLPGLIAKLRETPGVAPLALEFQILTALRPGEVVGAEWCEIDIIARTWTIPAHRMKKRKEHRVPLSTRAVAILERAKEFDSNFVFPGHTANSHLTTGAMLKILKDQGLKATCHGMRSIFRSWSAEYTSFPREVCEHALAHRIKDKTEEAYQRSDLFLKRRRLMEMWADFCAQPIVEHSNIVGINSQIA